MQRLFKDAAAELTPLLKVELKTQNSKQNFTNVTFTVLAPQGLPGIIHQVTPTLKEIIKKFDEPKDIKDKTFIAWGKKINKVSGELICRYFYLVCVLVGPYLNPNQNKFQDTEKRWH